MIYLVYLFKVGILSIKSRGSSFYSIFVLVVIQWLNHGFTTSVSAPEAAVKMEQDTISHVTVSHATGENYQPSKYGWVDQPSKSSKIWIVHNFVPQIILIFNIRNIHETTI